MNKDIRDALCDMGYDEAVVFDGPDFDEAIRGVTDEGQVVYDYNAMVRCMMQHDGITEEEAIEFIEYNTIRALPYFGPNAPIIMHPIEVYED